MAAATTSLANPFSHISQTSPFIADFSKSIGRGFETGERFEIDAALRYIGENIIKAHASEKSDITISKSDILRLPSVKTFRYIGIYHVLDLFGFNVWEKNADQQTYHVSWRREIKVFHPLPPSPPLPESFPQVKSLSGRIFKVRCSDGDFDMDENVLKSFPTWKTMLDDTDGTNLELDAPLNATLKEMQALRDLYTEYRDPASHLIHHFRLFELGHYLGSESVTLNAKGKIHLFAKEDEWQKVLQLGRTYRDDFLIAMGEALCIRSGDSIPASSESAASSSGAKAPR